MSIPKEFHRADELLEQAAAAITTALYVKGSEKLDALKSYRLARSALSIQRARVELAGVFEPFRSSFLQVEDCK